MTGDDLIDLAIQGDTILALGNHGVVARYRRNGEAEDASELPHGFEGRRLVIRDGMFYAVRGPIGYASVDGHIWRKAVAIPSEPSSTAAQTSQGDCVVERQKGSSRVRCTIDGIAYGLDEESALVIGSETVALTRSGGLGWDVSTKPLDVVVSAFGPADGPYVLLGEGGRVSVSDDGSNWVVRKTPSKHPLLTGIVTGDALVVGGKKGTLLRSTDQGESWTAVRSGTRGTITQLAMVHDRVVAFTGHRSVVSTDGGGSWRKETKGRKGKKRRKGVHSCGDDLPLAGERCAYTRRLRSPADHPDIHAVDFYGDSGLGFGDSALLAFTVDGGATWRVHHGVPTARIRTLAVQASRVLASDGRNSWVSVDGGDSFHSLPIPATLGPIRDSHVAEDGSMFLSGDRGTVLKATQDLSSWIPLSVGGDVSASITGI
ncbi:MAG: hypothetical protein VX938_05790, partial [Myxococcota bacterium]|nr:hypothetical protein [Myxococcota bacterium]